VVPAVLHPFPYVTVHVIQAKGVDGKTGYRQGLIAIFALRTALRWEVTVVVGLAGREAVAGAEPGGGAGSCGVFSFGLAGQAIALTGLGRKLAASSGGVFLVC